MIARFAVVRAAQVSGFPARSGGTGCELGRQYLTCNPSATG
ncbi:MAG: hypothetical protein ACXU82_14935 [Caulobacteraceae bacterium]